MNLGTSLTVAGKELKVIRRKKSIIYYIIALPLFLAVAFTFEVSSLVAPGIPDTLSLGLESFTFAYVILAVVLPTSVAAYSIVGEKVEKSLEPLLATPTTDGEVLLGKCIAAFVPPMMAIWVGSSIFMAGVDYLTYGGLSYYYFPDWNSGIMLYILAPLASILGIGIAVLASSRVSDVRGANQIGGLMVIPFIGLFVAGVTGKLPFSLGNLLAIAIILLIIDAALLFLSTSTFRREEILTKWR